MVGLGYESIWALAGVPLGSGQSIVTVDPWSGIGLHLRSFKDGVALLVVLSMSMYLT
jgi:hypothetical protein